MAEFHWGFDDHQLWEYDNGFVWIQVKRGTLNRWHTTDVLNPGGYYMDIPDESTPKQAQEKALELVRDKLKSLLNSIS